MATRSLDASRLGSAVERCYDAVILPELWPSVFQDFAEAANATGMIGFQFGTDSQKSNLLCSPSLAEATEVYVKDGWFLRNPRIPRALRVGTPDRLVSDKEVSLVRDHLDDVDAAWRHDFLERHGLGWFAGTDFFYNGGVDHVGISIERSIKIDPFQTDELAVLHRALAHMRKALSLAPSLDETAAKSLLSGLESSGQAAALLDRSGRIIRLNARAERLLAKTVRVRDGYLMPEPASARDRLQKFIASLLRRGPRCEDEALQGAILPRAGSPPLIVRGAPIAAVGSELFKRAKAFVTFTEIGRRLDLDSGILREAFELTPAEARIALEIARGRDCDEIACLHDISISTVRTHLKAIFAKTGTHRQAALAVMISGMGSRS